MDAWDIIGRKQWGDRMTVDSSVNNQLEMPVVLDELARRTHTQRGHDRAAGLRSATSLEEAERRLGETTQARARIETAGAPTFGGISDVGPLVTRAVRGGTLDASELLQVAECAHGLRQLKSHVEAPEDGEYGALSSLTSQIEIDDLLEKDVFRCIGEGGEVRDSASERLRELRREAHHLARAVQARVYEIVAETRHRAMLQDQLVTLRNGRYCVPIKSEFKGEFEGVVHDRSGSGATFFVEPVEIVNLNNRLRELHIDAAEEVERIFHELSGEVASRGERIRAALSAAEALDLIFAKGQLSIDWDCNAPRISKDGIFHLVSGRHPLLYLAAVPIDISVGKDTLALLITGPNTGGKTVALKTVGVLTLMARCGLHIPAAAGSMVSVLGEVFTDIGDDQSISRNLSTFSAHLSRIILILERAEQGSLILLDEIGTGTDPEEGAALASAVLEELTMRGARTIATSHHGGLKAFVHLHPDMKNAAVEFDEDNMKPTFRLLDGLPGSSHALAMAERLGMNSKIVERARRHLDPGRRAVDRLLTDLDARRYALETDQQAIADERRRVRDMIASLEEQQEAVRKDRAHVFTELRDRGRTLLQDAHTEIQDILRSLRTAKREGKETEVQRLRLKELEKRVEDAAALRVSVDPVCTDWVCANRVWDATLHPGDDVYLGSVRRAGILLSLPDESGLVWARAGNLRLQVHAREVSRPASPPPAKSVAGVSGLRLERALATATQLDLHGMRVQQAVEKLDRYLDDAVLGDLESVRIIHGIGTGALRKAIHEHLSRHPSVATFRMAEMDEGGPGATIVSLHA